MKRAPVSLLVLCVLLETSCASSGGAADRALAEAGRQRRREQPPPTAGELRLEIDSFVDNELPLLQRKADAALARELKTWRIVFIGGSALGVLGATSGSLSDSNGAAQAIVTSAGVLAAAAGGILYLVRTPELRTCKAFLDSARDDVVSFRRNALPPGEGTVGVATWHSWVDRVSAIRSHPSCDRLR